MADIMEETKNIMTAQQRYRANNKAKWNASIYKYLKKPYACECGSIMTIGNKTHHLKTKRHFTNLDRMEILKQKSVTNNI